jgi:hypothetical protein
MRQRFLYGFTEWYSNNYYPGDVAAMANFIQFSEDETMVNRMKMIMDLIWFDVASQAFKKGSIYFTYYKWDYSFSEISTYLSGTLSLFAVVSLIQPGKYLQLRWFVAGVLALGLGSKIRELDIAHEFTCPDSIFQGHALWHVLSCLMYVFLFLCFRSEEREGVSVSSQGGG